MKTIRDKEQRDKLIERYLKNLTMAKNLIDTLIPVIWKFDGKVYNRRLDNALKQATEDRQAETEGKQVYPYIEFELRKLTIKLAFYNHRIAEGGAYLPNEYGEVYIAYHYTNWSDWNTDVKRDFHKKDNGEFYYIDDNGNMRIQAERVVKELQTKQKDIEEEIKTIKDACEHVEETYNKVENLKAELSSIYDSLPRIVDKIYGIASYGTYIS